MRNTPIPLPPLVEQQRIVSKIEELFSELDKGIENLKTAQQQLKVYRQAVLKSAFEGKLTKDWRDQNPDRSVSEDILEEKDSSLGELPDGWKSVKLGNVIKDVEYGSSSKSHETGKIPVIRMGNIQNGLIDWEDLVYTNNQDEINKYLLKKDDVLFNRTNSSEWVGKTAIYKGERPAIFAGYLIRINRIQSLLDPYFLTYFLNSIIAKKYGNSVRTFGVNQSNINGTKLKSYPLPLPSLSEQQIIVQEIESRLSVCDKLEETIQSSLKQAESLRQSILKKAFEGKLAAQDLNDEPASVLLERIRAENESIFQKTNANSKKKTSKKQNPDNGNLIQFPRLVPDISTTELHAGVIAMVIDAHEKQSKYLENLNHVKCEKIAHLVESYIGISLGRNPVKDAAGPDDFPHLKLVESRALKANYFGIQKQRIGYTYLSKRGLQKVIDKVSKVLNLDEQGRIRNLIDATLKMDKEQAEIFATLYAGWNNLLLEGKKPSDEEIVYESRENWSPEKLKLSRSRFFTALGWMRKKGYVPEGKGVIVSKSVKKTPTKKRKKTKV
ncbi:type I restriction modification DNA specificity domain protein [Leptospira kirschneri]|nr:type I restriction modification DNA specificity domain protein [Leptospira kirschneri]